MMTHSLFGIILLVLDVWAIIRIAQSNAEPIWKAIWIVVVLVLPLFGLIIWWFFGPK